MPGRFPFGEMHLIRLEEVGCRNEAALGSEGFGIKVFSAKDTITEQREEKVGFFELK